jgi:site-specific DNA recombinase
VRNTNGIAGKIAVYLRQSLDREDNQLAIGRQRQACLDLIRRKGWDTGSVAEYSDNDRSASKGTRPEYQQLLADIESGAVGAVVTYHIDRLTRQPMELEQFMLLTDRNRVRLATVTGDIDLSTDDGQCMARMLGAFAAKEVARKSARQKIANRQRAHNGKAWNVRTFGYDGNELVQVEADAIRQACNDLLSGTSLYAIAKRWNAAGLPTTKGALWNGSTVRQVLTRARNAGLAVYDVHGSQRPGQTLKQRIDASIIDDAKVSWPAIVDRDTFDAVLSHLSNPARHTGKSHSNLFLLSGIAYCGLCGGKMGTGLRRTKTGAKRPVYQCKNFGCMKVVRDLTRTDELVVGVVTKRLARRDAAELFARQGVDTKALSADVNKYRELIRAAELEYDEGEIRGADLKRRRENLQTKIDAIEAQLVGARSKSRLQGLIGRADAANRFAKLDLDKRRVVVDTLATVTIMPTTKAGGVFDPELIEVDWRS